MEDETFGRSVLNVWTEHNSHGPQGGAIGGALRTKRLLDNGVGLQKWGVQSFLFSVLGHEVSSFTSSYAPAMVCSLQYTTDWSLQTSRQSQHFPFLR